MFLLHVHLYARRGHQTASQMAMSHLNSGPPRRAGNAPNGWAISPAPTPIFKWATVPKVTVTVGQGGRSSLLLEIFLNVPLFLKLQCCTILSFWPLHKAHVVLSEISDLFSFVMYSLRLLIVVTWMYISTACSVQQHYMHVYSLGLTAWSWWQMRALP